MRVLGVDGCRDGWVGVEPDPAAPRVYAAPDLRALIDRVEEDGPLAWIGVDIPVGLADHGWREADRLAQGLLGPRRSSIFPTPVRAALEAPDHASGVAISRELSGAGFSIQAWGLAAKVLEVDRLVRGGETRVLEVHPELSFTTMAGRPAARTKKTWAGQRERLALLASHGIDLAALTGDPGLAAPDDVVDAAAVAWTAQRLALGTAVSVPDPPEPVPYGLTAAIWA